MCYTIEPDIIAGKGRGVTDNENSATESNGGKKKIILTYASAGAGHKIACRAVEQAIYDNGFAGIVKSIDVLQYMPKPAAKIFSDGYLWAATKLPWLWYLIYESGGSLSKFSPISNWQAAVLKLLLRKVNHIYLSEKPDYIISAYFTASWLAGRYKRLYDSKCMTATIVTDYGIHPTWIIPDQNRYFVATEDMQIELANFEWYTRVNKDKIVTAGIPVEKRFTLPRDKHECRARYNLSQDKFTVLILAGVYGRQHIKALVEALARCSVPIQILVVARQEFSFGDGLLTKLAEKNILFRTYGHIGFMEELMTCADIAITKTGGLTSSECLNSGCPLFVYLPYPGQEERNASIFLERGAAWRIYQLESLPHKIDYLANHPEKHQAMADAAKSIIRPQAADSIARIILEDLR